MKKAIGIILNNKSSQLWLFHLTSGRCTPVNVDMNKTIWRAAIVYAKQKGSEITEDSKRRESLKKLFACSASKNLIRVFKRGNTNNYEDFRRLGTNLNHFTTVSTFTTKIQTFSKIAYKYSSQKNAWMPYKWVYSSRFLAFPKSYFLKTSDYLITFECSLQILLICLRIKFEDQRDKEDFLWPNTLWLL